MSNQPPFRYAGFDIVMMKTKQLTDSVGAAKFCVSLAANIDDSSKLDELVAELLRKFEIQRMISPPDTSMLLITIMGNVEIESVMKSWAKTIETHSVAKAFLSLMESANLGVGKPHATEAEWRSLLATLE